MEPLSFLNSEELRARLPSKWSGRALNTISLTTSELDLRPPSELVENYFNAVSGWPLGYQSYGGHPAVKHAIAQFESKRRKLTLSGDNITLVTGVRAVVNAFLAKLFATDDIALIFVGSPTYRPLFNTIKQTQRIINLPFSSDGSIDFSPMSRESIGKIGAILLVNPHNPTGLTIQSQDLSELIEIALAHNATIISNEVNSHALYAGDHFSIIDINAVQKTRWIVVSSLTKWFCLTGQNIGYCLHAEKNPFKELGIYFNSITRPSSLDQLLLMLCTEMGNEWLEMVMRQLANNSLYIDRFLQGYPVLRGVRARGGSSIWVNLPENLPSAYFVNYLSKFAEVDCWDNRRFYPSDVNGFRISIGAAFTTIKEACDRIAIHLPKVIEAVEMKR